MNNNISKEFISQIEELNNDLIETPYGIFTSNTHLGLTAQEVYEQWLASKDKVVEVVESKEINIEEALKAVLAGDYQTLAYILYPDDFE